MTRRATAESTRRYAARFQGRAADGHFREVQGIVVSSIGIGTYLGNPDDGTDAAYTNAVEAAVENGINLIDTAINYRFMRSEGSIREALLRLAAKGYAPEEVVICTKGGYLTPDIAMPKDPNAYFFEEYVRPGTLRPQDIAAGCHAMTPRYIENQLERSLRNLGTECVDVYYLHNPETQLSEVPRADFLARLREVFEMLEAVAEQGKIQFYGMATWNGFRQPAGARDAMSLGEIVEVARQIAGEKHRFRFVQLPFNLGMTEALTLGNQKIGERTMTVMEAAHELGITLIGSASLLQGQVARNLPGFVAEAFGLENDAQRALQFARSAPGITAALVGMSRVEHVRANARLTGVPPATLEQFSRLFMRGEGV